MYMRIYNDRDGKPKLTVNVCLQIEKKQFK